MAVLLASLPRALMDLEAIKLAKEHAHLRGYRQTRRLRLRGSGHATFARLVTPQ
jgi:hypothetical protein